MTRRTLLGIGSIVFLSAVHLSWAAEIPFKRVTVDESVKDPWAKIIADIDGDGFADLVIGGRAGPLVWYKHPDWTKHLIAKGGYKTVDGEAGDIDGDLDLLGANWSGPCQPVELWENQSGKAGKGDGYEVRIPVRVGAAGFEREPRPVEVPLDFTRLLTSLGRTAPGNDPVVRVAEVDASGRVMHDISPVQFDQDPAHDPKTALRGTLTFMLPGRTPAQTERIFHVGLDFKRGAAATGAAHPFLTVADNVDHEGQESFQITTPEATYYYHKQGAGFASLEDRDGNDWLSYNPGVGPVSNSGSGGKYRGLPNLVHPAGYFHPGNDQCTSRLLAAGPVKATIASESGDGKWACRWDIFPGYARLTVLKADHAYWFLYEGTPGGKLDENSDYCVRSDGTKTLASARWQGDISAKGEAAEWLYFGDSSLNRVLYLIHEEDDEAVDSYWPMNREMTVFGFGRKGVEKHMKQVPAHFIVGFCESADFAVVAQTVQSAYRPLALTIGDPQIRE